MTVGIRKRPDGGGKDHNVNRTDSGRMKEKGNKDVNVS